MKQSARFQWPVRPAALPENTVAGNTYRFTVLMPGLLRLEYDPSGRFEDRASQTVFYRDFPRCGFSCKKENGLLVLETSSLRLTYRESEPFSADTLRIDLLIPPASGWRFGEDFEDLGGTVRTLDAVDGAIPLGRGVVSRNGFSVLDDSDTLVLDYEDCDCESFFFNEDGTSCKSVIEYTNGCGNITFCGNQAEWADFEQGVADGQVFSYVLN